MKNDWKSIENSLRIVGEFYKFNKSSESKEIDIWTLNFSDDCCHL